MLSPALLASDAGYALSSVLRPDFVFDSTLDQLVETDALGRSRFHGASVKLRVDACIEAAGEVADRINTVLFADFEERRQGLGAFGFERGNVAGVEVRAPVQAEKFAAQHVGIEVIHYNRAIVVDAQDIHGFTPFDSSRLRTLAVAPLSVVGRGCGR